MSDMRSMSREMKKKQLRNNIVQLPNQNRQFSNQNRQLSNQNRQIPYEEEEDSEEVIRKFQRGRRKKRILITLIVVIFLAVLGICWYQYQNEYEYTEYHVAWQQAMRFVDAGTAETEAETETAAEGESGRVVRETGFVKFAYFGENMIKYTKDGATYIDASGKNVWTQSYEMKMPVINVNGNYVIIADQQGNDIYICNTEGCTGVARTQLPITKAAVSAKGVTAAVVEDGTASYIFYFKKDGENLGINIKMLLSGDGYPVDLALSPDGKQIVMSVMYMKNGSLKNKVVFYDFSEIGKNVNNRFVGGFEEEFDDKMVARVRYLNEDTVCAFSDKGLTFISVKDVIPDVNVISVPVEEEIESICYSEQYAAVVVDNPSGNPYRMDVYTTDGKKVTSIEFDYPYTGVEIDGEKILLYNEESCQVYNMDGYKKFEGQFDFAVSCVRAGKKHLNSLVVAGSEIMQEIRLK